MTYRPLSVDSRTNRERRWTLIVRFVTRDNREWKKETVEPAFRYKLYDYEERRRRSEESWPVGHDASRGHESAQAYHFAGSKREIFGCERTRGKNTRWELERISFKWSAKKGDQEFVVRLTSLPLPDPAYLGIQFGKGYPFGTRISLRETSCN